MLEGLFLQQDDRGHKGSFVRPLPDRFDLVGRSVDQLCFLQQLCDALTHLLHLFLAGQGAHAHAFHLRISDGRLR